MTIAQDIASLNPGTLVELFEVDATALGGSLVRFHAGTNGLRAPVVWQGNTYSPLPVEATGFDYNGKGQLPRPMLRVANIGGLITAQALAFNDLLGAKVTRKRTLAKYLDAANFPARRNLLSNTDDFSATYWFGSQIAARQANVLLAPDGNVTADGIVPSTANTTHYVERNTAGLVAGQAYPSSIYVYPGSGRDVRFYVYGTGNAAHAVILNTVTGVATLSVTAEYTSGGGVTTDWAAEKLPGGWWRLRLVGFPDAAATNRRIRVQLTNASGAATFAGDGVTAAAYLWGAQLEYGSAVTDYQPIGATWSQNPTADPTAALADDVFYIDRKASENKVLIEFELAAAFDVSGVQLPRRVIAQNVCPWRYRVVSESSACTYAGTAYFDASDAPVGSAAADVCGKRLSSCKLRFGASAELPIGGFPGAGLAR